ncbi:MAG: hypothetical protein IPN69_00325 [Acidobacteria bacterium]|nr:hypothetical protein [Acidobacteriota bacterium]
MAKATKKLDETKTLFIDDRALESEEFDAFGHLDYARVLEQLVLNQPTPFNIGIYGKWGVGKSTIVNLLRQRLGSKVKFIEIKVWKFDENSLRRKFIISIANELGFTNQLSAIADEMYSDRETETALVDIHGIVSTIFDIRSVALWFLIISFAVVVIFNLVLLVTANESDFSVWGWRFEKLVAVPLYLAAVNWVFSLIKGAKAKIKRPKLDSEEQFETRFCELVKRDSTPKLIFIDDLDRCSKEKVLSTLETIKTFLDVETCIFIIACDDEIIKQAVNRSLELYGPAASEGTEYLEKFFQYTIRIPPFMIPDMRRFVRTSLERNKNELVELDRFDDILFILINPNVKSPRNAISALNEFAALYFLARKRESDKRSQLPDRIVTQNLPLLALVSTTRIQYPSLFADLLVNNELLHWLIAVIEDRTGELSERQRSICSNHIPVPGLSRKDVVYQRQLREFLESTKEYFYMATDLTPFLYLGLDSTSYLVGDQFLQEFNDAIRNGIESKTEKILREANSDTKESLFEHLANSIDSRLTGVEKRKALQMISKHWDLCPNSAKGAISRCFFRHFRQSAVGYSELSGFSIGGVFSIASALDESDAKLILNSCVDKLDTDDPFVREFISNSIERFELIFRIGLQSEISKLIDKLSSESRETEKGAETTFLDYCSNEVVKNKLNMRILEAFFMGNYVDIMVETLLEADKLADEEPAKFGTCKQCFDALKGCLRDSDLNRYSNVLSKLTTTDEYFEQVIDDIEEVSAELTKDQVLTISRSLITEIISIGNVDLLARINRMLVNGFETYPKNVESCTSELSELFDASFGHTSAEPIGSFNVLYPMIAEHLPIDLRSKFVSDCVVNLNPNSELEKAISLRKLIVHEQMLLNDENKKRLIKKLTSGISDLDFLRNDQILEFWKHLVDECSVALADAGWGAMVGGDTPQNVLSSSHPMAQNSDRIKFSGFLRDNFERLTESEQTSYINLLSPFTTNPNAANTDYVVESISSIRSKFHSNNPLSNLASLLYGMIPIAASDARRLELIDILFSARSALTEDQLNELVGLLTEHAGSNLDLASKVLVSQWGELTSDSKIALVCKLLVSDDQEVLKRVRITIAPRIVDELITTAQGGSQSFLHELAVGFSGTEDERTLFAQVVSGGITDLPTDIKDQIVMTTVNELRSESNIDISRNLLTVLIVLRDKDYDKNNKINDLFFNLMNGSIAQKKLAIDVFDFYYSKRHPHQRKGELTQRFKALVDDFRSDPTYRGRLHSLAEKYDLKIKRSIWDFWD